jgi:hypothetical protein
MLAGGGFGVTFGATEVFGDGLAAGVPSATLAFGCGVGRASLDIVEVFDSSGALAGATEDEIAAFVQI